MGKRSTKDADERQSFLEDNSDTHQVIEKGRRGQSKGKPQVCFL